MRNAFADVSNLDPDNEVWGENSRQRMFQLGNRLWHTDSSFKRLPALASLLYARSIPPIGGHTEFADERAAYDALPEDMKRRLHGLVVERSIFNSRARLGFTEFSDEERKGMPPVPQALVRTIAESGRKSLYLASHAGRVFGTPEPEGRALIDELIAHATQRQFVYTHRWRVHDLVIWDNRCTMHGVYGGTATGDATSCWQESGDVRHRGPLQEFVVSQRLDGAPYPCRSAVGLVSIGGSSCDPATFWCWPLTTRRTLVANCRFREQRTFAAEARGPHSARLTRSCQSAANFAVMHNGALF